MFCRAAVVAALGRVPGVVALDVDVRSDSATVLYDPTKATINDLKQAMAEIGFRVRGVREVKE